MKFFCCLSVVLLVGILGSCSSTQHAVKLSATNPVIHFDRSGCFGACPAYTLTLRGDGSAWYTGHSFVDKLGRYEARVAEKDIRFLVERFAAVGFYSMKDVYDDLVTDIPTYTLKYTLNDSTKTVIDRYNPPQELRDLERQIDSIADGLKWQKVME